MLRREDRALFGALVAIAASIVLCWAVPSPHGEGENRIQKCATHECREDAAAETLADYTKWLAWFTGLLFIASVAQGFFLLRADKLTRRSIELARDEFNATHRPRVKIRVISAPEVETDRTATFRVVVVNVGDTPANITNYRLKAWLFTGEESVEIVLKAEDITQDVWLESGDRQIFEHRTQYSWIDPGQSTFWLDGEITYTDGRNLTRRTGFARKCDMKRGTYSVFDLFAEYEYED
jgi:hypothetical protein